MRDPSGSDLMRGYVKMKSMRRFFVSFTVAILVSVGSGSHVFATNDPIISLESESKIEIDLKMVVDDLLPLIQEAAAAESEEKAAWFQMVVDLVGIHALDRLYAESSVNKKGGRTRATISLVQGAEDGLLPAMFSMSPGEYRFGSYVADEDVMLLVSLTNFSAFLEILLDFIVSSQIHETIPQITVDENGEVDLFGIKPKQDILPLLAGELDLFLLTPEDDYEGDIPPFALALRTTDGNALRAKLFEIFGQHADPEMAAEMASMPGEPVGEFLSYVLPGGVSYAVSQDFLVVTSETERMAARLAEPSTNTKPIQALKYVRLNGDLLLELLAAEAVAEGEHGSPEEQMKAELMEALGDQPIGMLELQVTSKRSGSIDMEMNFPGALIGMQYRLLREALAMAPKAQALETERALYREHVSYFDEALTAYGIAHDGIFPEDPQDLVETGYLDVFPELEPTPLGEYQADAYSYVPLRDEGGAVVGYYLFVYGVGPDTGYDVFTEANLVDPANFQVSRDGKPDGVAGFCYDGIALDHVEEWQREH